MQWSGSTSRIKNTTLPQRRTAPAEAQGDSKIKFDFENITRAIRLLLSANTPIFWSLKSLNQKREQFG